MGGGNRVIKSLYARGQKLRRFTTKVHGGHMSSTADDYHELLGWKFEGKIIVSRE